MTAGAAGYYFDEEAADRAVRFIEIFCSFTKGRRGPFILEPWQKEDIIRPLFGWKRPDGRRKYRTAYIEIPRKNGKSNLAAAIALLLLFADGEDGAEVISAAGSRDQARLVFTIAREMTLANQHLRKRSTILRNEIHVGTSFYRSISAQHGTAHGLNIHGLVMDELHTQPNRHLWDTLTTATGARSQPLIVAITTAGMDRTSICGEVHDYAIQVRDGIVEDPTFLPIIYAADATDDWTSPDTWAKANPGLGTIVRREYFEDLVRRSMATPSLVNTFKRLHLNIWTGSNEGWITVDEYDQGGEAIPWDRLKGVPCYGGLDLSSTRDLTAFALVWDFDGTRIALVHHFCNEETANSAGLSYGTPYLTWAEAGHVTITAGNVTDHNAVRDHILRMSEIYDIKAIGYDRHLSQFIIPQLIEAGLDLRPFGQGFISMNEPTKRMEMDLVGGHIVHGGDPVLRWQIGCVHLDTDPAGNVKISKKKTKLGEKVDGLVALAMAYGIWIIETHDPTPSIDFSQIISL